MKNKKLKKQIKALQEALDSHIESLRNVINENEQLTEKQDRLQLNIKMIEEKLRFALVHAKAPTEKAVQWLPVDQETYHTMPMHTQEKLGCIPIETSALTVVDNTDHVG